MIVTCPSCAARYRVREDKIQGKGARITCPKCTHKFVVYLKTERMVVGQEAPRGLGVKVKRRGQVFQADPEEEDEDVPTTVMPQGSKVAQQIREAAARARMNSAEQSPAAMRAATDGPRAGLQRAADHGQDDAPSESRALTYGLTAALVVALAGWALWWAGLLPGIGA